MKKNCFIILFALCCSFLAFPQGNIIPDSALVNTLKFRSIGPAMTSGRIADIAVNPKNPFEMLVAVASGNIWKTSNNGTTWKPVFENYGSYSTACLAYDPENANIVWAGTGENNSQRALGYGDGIYKSADGGDSWTNMGLKNSQQIGKIIVDPDNPDIVYAAAVGSVWGPGGERGLYKTTDGGKTWAQVLKISENTGIEDLVMDPCNPDVLLAVAHQRRRRSYTKIDGGPESAIYKSVDAGKTWKKANKGLPSVDLGAIGVAISPVNHNIVYALVEAANGEDGFFRSDNLGESWKKMSGYKTSGGQYFHEIYCDTKNENKVYIMDTYSKVTIDGGKTWQKLSTKFRHVDDHALWIDPADNAHLYIGGDGGVYESYDSGETWKFVANLPVTQFYRVGVDNAEPFYNVYGGTQDNNTIGGPSRNTSNTGVSNDEWNVTVGGDGFWVAADPKDPNTIYCEYQYGNAYRFNKKNGELLYIKPQEAKGELTYKWNWNAPLILSPHSNSRLYMAANKVFMSNDKGNSWQVISGDLTHKTDRNSFKVMGKYWSFDAVAKDVSTSQYGTIVSLAESPVKEGLVYAGTDDGVISVTDDNGKNWQSISKFPGVPEYTYVSDIFPSRFDENIVYVTFDNLKSDDFKPYILFSRDKGKTWGSISSNLPVNGPVHTISQDFVDPDMLFCGTEFGAFISFDNGKSWIAMKNGLPTIRIDDIAIQKRENDLILATFGRGMYILDDYSSLRSVQKTPKNTEAGLMPVKTAKLYIPVDKRSSFGDNYFVAKNPPFGAIFNAYLKDSIKSSTVTRHEQEAKLFKKGEKIKVISWKDERDEKLEEPPYLLFVVEDKDGNVVRKITAKPNKGFNRVAWDLKYPAFLPDEKDVKEYDPFKAVQGGIYVMPGTYSVQLFLSDKGEIKPLTEKVNFNVEALNTSGFNASDRDKTFEFQHQVSEVSRKMVDFDADLSKYISKVQKLKQDNLDAESFDASKSTQFVKLAQTLDSIDLQLNGFKLKASPEEVPPSHVPVMNRLYFVVESFISSSAPITSAQKESFKIVEIEFGTLTKEFDKAKKMIDILEKN